ncbi:MAG: Rpn family recombination-promoting nuclease/putative transposase [Bacteroidota bacterium]
MININIQQAASHDDNFKHNFSCLIVALAFLKHNLPKKLLAKLDLSTLRIAPNEFLPSRYRTKRNADIVYSVKDKKGNKIYIFIHLEAQSTHDKNMAIRIWEYHVAIGRAHFRQGYKKIPFIQTFVLYHGKAPWTSPKSIAELFEDFDQYCTCALKAPFLIDLNTIDIKSLQTQEAAAAPQIILKGQAKGEYCDILPILYPLMKKYGQDDEENIFYMINNDQHATAQLFEKLSNFAPEITNKYTMMFQLAVQKEAAQQAQKLAKDLANDLAKDLAKKQASALAKQKLKKEAPKFIQIGVTQGKKEEKQVIIRQLIASRLKKEEIARMLQMPLQALETLLA